MVEGCEGPVLLCDVGASLPRAPNGKRPTDPVANSEEVWKGRQMLRGLLEQGLWGQAYGFKAWLSAGQSADLH